MGDRAAFLRLEMNKEILYSLNKSSFGLRFVWREYKYARQLYVHSLHIGETG